MGKERFPDGVSVSFSWQLFETKRHSRLLISPDLRQEAGGTDLSSVSVPDSAEISRASGVTSLGSNQLPS